MFSLARLHKHIVYISIILVNYTFSNPEVYTVKKIHENTPLVFQWFVLQKSKFKFGENQVPIPNTKKYPYLDNIKKAASIENHRKVIVFCDGFSRDQINASKSIESEFSNLRFIHKNQLDFDKYDKGYFEILENSRENISEKDYKLLSTNDTNSTLFSEKSHDHSHFDLFRNLFLLKGASVLREAGVQGCQNISPNDGLVYLDCDFKINKKIGDIYSLDGISIYSADGKNIENSFIAVDRPNHPALLKGLDYLHKDVCAHPYYDGVCRGIKDYFIPNNKSLCDQKRRQEISDLIGKIKFKSNNVDMDTSKLEGSSW